MVADWTNEDADIAALLKKHGRNGIPLYLLYEADTAAEPQVLPQVLTKNTVLQAIQSVSDKNTDVATSF
jgi:thiol:disulfide interchange protein DsbD